MGYQESYVTTKKAEDFDKLCNYFKSNKLWIEDEGPINPVEIITLLQPVSGNYEYMDGTLNRTYKYPAGSRFLYFVGERYYQSDIYRLFDLEILQPGKKDMVWIKNVQIIFTEDFPSDAIFGENGLNPIATHELFVFD